MTTIEQDFINLLYDGLIKEGFLIILACLGVGYIIKHCMPKISNNFIVPILAICGIILSFGLATKAEIDANAFQLGVKGFILGCTSTGIFEFGRGIIRIGGKDMLIKILKVILNSKDKE